MIKNAVKNIYRYKSKYILFGVLYLALILAASVCVNIFVQMERATDHILREYAGVSRFAGRASGGAGMKRRTKEEFLEYINTEHVSDVRFLRYNFATTEVKENAAEVTAELHIGGEIIHLFVYRPVFVLG